MCDEKFVCWVVPYQPSQQYFSHVGTEPPFPGYFINTVKVK